jgi:hypothetical protein
MEASETGGSIFIEYKPINGDLGFDLAEFELYLTLIEEMLDEMEREDEEFEVVEEPTEWV